MNTVTQNQWKIGAILALALLVAISGAVQMARWDFENLQRLRECVYIFSFSRNIGPLPYSTWFPTFPCEYSISTACRASPVLRTLWNETQLQQCIGQGIVCNSTSGRMSQLCVVFYSMRARRLATAKIRCVSVRGVPSRPLSVECVPARKYGIQNIFRRIWNKRSCILMCRPVLGRVPVAPRVASCFLPSC